MTDLTGKTAVITGSARGIGRAIALRYAGLGADIVVNYASSKTAAEDTAAEIEKLGRQALTVQADMNKVADIQRLFDESAAHFGKIDIAIANAGVEEIGIDFLDITEEQFDRLFTLNTKGAFFTLQAAARTIAENGRIIYLGSTVVVAPVPREALYGSSKTAARYAASILAQELADRGVTVNSILPTGVEGAGVFTNIDDDHWVKQAAAGPGHIGRRMARVDDVADAAEYLASDLASWLSGQSLLITGGAPV
ncbi:SDR family oxidoreductase [Streptacidiphilus anmyonensis]|uniref:SDR family oxidoreductase n=1 Tax=Streptacidiphilus anmyonensis TaxID=405782 RepID=UPI0005A771D1|nr:SDR family oxidoreductase [Streptacidiphilus anmyonensis]